MMAAMTDRETAAALRAALGPIDPDLFKREWQGEWTDTRDRTPLTRRDGSAPDAPATRRDGANTHR